MNLGAAYAFDEVAYNRFYPLAQREGYDFGPEDFSTTGPGKGVHLVRVQLTALGSSGQRWSSLEQHSVYQWAPPNQPIQRTVQQRRCAPLLPGR